MDHDAGGRAVPAQEMQPLWCVEPPEPVMTCCRHAGQQPVGQHCRREIRLCSVQRDNPVPQPQYLAGLHGIPDAPSRESGLQKGSGPCHGAGVFEVRGEFDGPTTASDWRHRRDGL